MNGMRRWSDILHLIQELLTLRCFASQVFIIHSVITPLHCGCLLLCWLCFETENQLRVTNPVRRDLGFLHRHCHRLRLRGRRTLSVASRGRRLLRDTGQTPPIPTIHVVVVDNGIKCDKRSTEKKRKKKRKLGHIGQ